MPVELYEFASLERRVKAIEDSRHKEAMDGYEEQRKRSERQMWALWFVCWVVIVAGWSAIITAAIVGD